MRGRLRRSIGELLMDVDNDDAPQAALDDAPPGHFPAYITPDEAEQLRSGGGGVAPGGGQYMVDGIPAFFVGEAGFGGGEGEPGDPGGFGGGDADPGQGAFGGVGGEFGGLGFDADPGQGAFGGVGGEFGGLGGEAGVGVGTGDVGGAEGDSPVGGIGQDTSLGQVSIDPGFGSLGVDPGSLGDPTGGFAEMDAAIAAAQAQAEAETSGMPTTEEEAKGITAFQSALELDQLERAQIEVAIIEDMVLEEKAKKDKARNILQVQTLRPAKARPVRPAKAVLSRSLLAPVRRGLNLDITSLLEDISKEEQEDIDRENQATIDKARNITQSKLDKQAKDAKEGYHYAHIAYDDKELAAIMAANAITIGFNPDATDDEGNLNALGLSLAGKDFSKGGFGSMSPAGFNANFSEVARSYKNAIEEGTLSKTDPSEISLQALSELNFDTGLPGKGWDINEPQPSAGGILASHIWGRLNPTMTNALFGIGSLVPGFAGTVAQLAGIKEGKGFGPLAMQAIENVPVIGPLATDFQGWLDEVGTQLGGLLPGQGALGGLMAATDQGDLSLADMPDFGEDPGGGEPEGPGDPVFEYDSPPLPEDVVIGPQPQQPDQEEEERPLLAAGPLLSPLLPPALALAPTPTFGAANLPPVFTEEDARALLQQTGQLPFAGIV